MMKEVREKYFPTRSHPEGRGFLPWYERVGRKVFRSYGHPEGKSNDAEFIVQQDKLIPLTGERGSEMAGAPWFVLREGQVYPGYGHPEGSSRLAWFEER